MFGAENLMVDIGGAKVPVAVFGKGKRSLIMLPGLGDGLTTVKGKALFMAAAYREFSKDFRVFMMSRRIPLPENFTTKDMAEDLAKTMEALGIENADIVGVSMGGMIAQHFAASYPEKTGKVVLVATSPEANEIIKSCVGEWVALAKAGKCTEFMKSNVKNMYSDEYYRKNAFMTPIIGRISVPKDLSRFLSMAKACLEHSAEAVLGEIKAPVLIIGGTDDRTVGAKASYELAEKIPGAEIFMYEGLRHAVYDEAPDFNKRVLEYLKK